MAINLSINELTAAQNQTFVDNISEASASWTLDAVSEIAITVHDLNRLMFLGNYFQLRRNLTYPLNPSLKVYPDGIQFFTPKASSASAAAFEIAAAEIRQGAGASGQMKIQARRKAIQVMKRDYSAGAVRGLTATDYAMLAAQRYGLDFVGQATKVSRTIQKPGKDGIPESTWAALTRLASEADFTVFESDNTLFFCSETWLLNKWANVIFKYPSPETGSAFRIIEIPNCRRSEDNYSFDIQASFLLERNETVMALRPGMTIHLNGMGEFDRNYLIAEVAYGLDINDPIGISCRTPKDPKEKRYYKKREIVGTETPEGIIYRVVDVLP